MRTALLAACLAACSRGEPAAEQTAAETADSHVPCALAGARDFAPACTREIAQGADGEVWIIRHPDGGFRRFVLIDKDTRIAAADGADEVRAERVGPDLEVRVVNDRYLFPAAPDARAS